MKQRYSAPLLAAVISTRRALEVAFRLDDKGNGITNLFGTIWSPAQPLVAQVCTLGLNNEGRDVARSSVVIIRLVDDRILRIKLADRRRSAGNCQLACLGCGNVPHKVLGNAAV